MTETPLLRMKNVSKSFPGVQALDSVDFEVYAGEVLGLIGENGAGKSTLMKILSGVYPMDSGQIYLNGAPVVINNPHHAQKVGISIIYQEFNLMPNMTVMENIFMGREPGFSFLVNYKELEEKAERLLDRIGVRLSPMSIVRDLLVAQQQMVEIAKALSWDVRVIIMDEPTSALSDKEVQTLFAVIKELRRNGIGIVFISHRLGEIQSICDRIEVLRDGRNVGTLVAEKATNEELIRMMVGRPIEQFFHKQFNIKEKATTSDEKEEDVVLEVRNLSSAGAAWDPSSITLNNICFNLRRGEILGLAGLVGAGRTEAVRIIFGADKRDEGEIFIDGERVNIRSPRDAIRHGIGLVPEDRKEQGLILWQAVRDNLSLVNLDKFTHFGFINFSEEKQKVEEYINRLAIRTPSLDQLMVNLSGGNQQKVVISKWLMLNPKILILDEPTRGIDVGAKAEIYALMDQLASSGVSIIMISSELSELLAMSDRIVCVAEGHVTGILDRSAATPEKVMQYCTMQRDRTMADTGL